MRSSHTDTNGASAPDEFHQDICAAIAELQSVDATLSPLGLSLVKPASLHDENGAVLWVSASAARLLGISDVRDAEAGQGVDLVNYLKAINVQDRVGIAHFLSGQYHRSEAETAEFRRLDAGTRQDEPHWIEISRSSFTGQKSGRKLVLASYRDITRAKHSELNAIRLKEKNEEASAAKSRFLANISHELRTPLNAILGFSELLSSPIVTTFSEEKKSEYVGLIHESAKHLLNLLNSILDMSKIESGMYEIFPESFCLKTCIQNTAAIMRGQAELRGIQLRLSGLEELPDVVADERALRQIMINLLSNAIKFSHDNSTVQVHARRKARTVEIAVKDNGVGISEDNLANLCQPFFQADSKYDRKYEGTGLGLSVVKGLIELHRGDVRFESVRGEGTTVTISFPINSRSGRQVPSGENIQSVVHIKREAASAGSSLRGLRNSA